MSYNSHIIRKKPLLFVYSIRKNIINILFVSFTIFLVLFSNSCLLAVKNALKLWANNVVPALFPFFIATELLAYTNLCNNLSRLFSKIITPIFKVPGCGAYAFILGLISGYPIGAKIVTELRNSKHCSKNEGSRLLAFTNNSGPLFIIGTVGITLFRNTTIGILLLITHILSAITVGFILRFFDNSNKNIIKNYQKSFENASPNYRISDMGEILRTSIIHAIKNIFVIGGFIVLFAVIISMLESSHILDIILYTFNSIFRVFNIDITYLKGIIIGMLELTNGLSIISSVPAKSISINIILCAFLLGFGGISVLFQVLSIISKSDLSIKPYIYGKLLQGIIAAIYTFLFMSSFDFLNFNL